MLVIITCPVGVVLTLSGATMFVFNVDVVVDVVPMVLTLALAIGVTAPDQCRPCCLRSRAGR